jgi:hypothetical protein
MKLLVFLSIPLVGSAFLIGASPAAHATLGEPANSVATDAAQMNATAGAKTAHPVPGVPAQNTPASANFTIEQMTTPDGTVVSEYVGPDATVFAVTWRGAMPPDVRTLLGTYFKQYRDAADNGSPSPLGLHALSVQAADVKVETAGHMGFMWGRAYLPARLPAGVTISEIK